MNQILKRLGIKEINNGVCTGLNWISTKGEQTISVSPIDNKTIAKINNASLKDYEFVVKKAQDAFKVWRVMPAPKRGRIYQNEHPHEHKGKYHNRLAIYELVWKYP